MNQELKNILKMKFSREDQIDITLFFSLFRCFHEQLYSMKGRHAGILKKKFNLLIKIARQYEKELLKHMEDSQELEDVYDCLMDVIQQVRNQIDENDESTK